MGRRMTTEQYRVEILAAVSRSEPYYGAYSSISGTRQRNAAEALRDEGKVKLVTTNSQTATLSDLQYVAIPPASEWDGATMQIKR